MEAAHLNVMLFIPRGPNGGSFADEERFDEARDDLATGAAALGIALLPLAVCAWALRRGRRRT
jgi:hypothetical protein